LLLPEGQADEAWGLSENQRCFGTTAALGGKLLSLFYEPPNFTVIPVHLKLTFSRL